jgi:OOP family OmpA-OmpF porin
MIEFNKNLIRVTAKLAVIALSAAFLLSGCATKSDKELLPATANPTEELAKLEAEYTAASIANTDVLAPEQYGKGSEYLGEARKDMKDGEEQSEVIESLSYATSYLQKANEVAEGRKQYIPAALAARARAIEVGATKQDITNKKLKKLDHEIEKASDRLDKDLSAEDVARLERGYMSLETQAVQGNLLGQARSRIQGSIDTGADKRTPQTLKKAQIDLKTAETAIATNFKVHDAYSQAVEKANASALYLVDVLAAAKKNGDSTSEAVAVKLVDQNRKIGNLSGNLQDSQGNLASAQGKVDFLGKTVDEQNKALTFQKAIDEARRSFSKADAEVFQQGKNLVIRLKTMNFKSGQAELSQQSLAILTKVSSVVNSLPIQKVVVEGHTDSTGTAAINEKLSADRAKTVATYLETSTQSSSEIEALGFGYKKPIASNKSKQGRAQNRRVDVVISTATSDKAISQ